METVDNAMHRGTIATLDVPQHDDLAKLRALVEALNDGTEPSALGAAAGLTRRHVEYALHAGRILGWVSRSDDQTWSITGAGEALLGHPAGSDGERRFMRDAVMATALVRDIVPGLLDRTAPDEASVAGRLMAAAGLSPSTAARRALTLRLWREQLVAAEAASEPEPTAPPEPPVVAAPPSPAGPPSQLSLWD